MFSQTVEYALRAMVQLASDAPEASTTRQIAKKTKVPSAYLAKVLQSMRRAGLINSRRGVGGGVTLAQEPDEISLLDVIDAVEPLKRSGRRRGKTVTPLQRTLDNALVQVRKTFEAVSLSDMLSARRGGSKPRRRKRKHPAPRAKRTR
ncbi:MAG: transcriptional regulator [Planctomycetota bacterium]|nr:MAG: transcriptional regulator [Planctomycetota bacterium]